MPSAHLSEFGGILLFIIGGVLFVLLAMTAARLLRPNRPNEEKLSSYECGEEAVGSAWGPFNVRFYIIALIFILFDIELVFLFPWAVVFGQKELIVATNGLWGWFALAEMAIFIVVLAVGLAYAWAKGYLDWIRPEIKLPMFESKIPPQVYRQINEKYKGNKAPLDQV